MRQLIRGTNEGFSLVELSVSIVLISIVAGAALGSYVLVSRSVSAWQERVRKQSEVHLMSQRVLADLFYSCGVSSTDDLWAICDMVGQSVWYRTAGDSVFRNDRLLQTEAGLRFRRKTHEDSARLDHAVLMLLHEADTTTLRIRTVARNDPAWHLLPPLTEIGDVQ